MLSLRMLALSVLCTALLGGVGACTAGLKAYAAGRAKEKQVQEGIIGRMVERHRTELDEQRAKNEAQAEAWRLQRKGAERAQELERAAARDALASINADRGRLRDELAAFAAGGRQAADDTVDACRARAAALGDVLDEALQAHAECTAESESLAAGVRTMQRSWPSSQPTGVAP